MIDPKIELSIKESASNETFNCYPSGKSEDYAQGWNDGLMQLLRQEIRITDWLRALPENKKESVNYLLVNDIIMISLDDPVNPLMSINANDTFSYASAESVDVELSEVEEVVRAHKEFGNDGTLAWMSVKQGSFPLAGYVNDNFRLAYNKLNALKEEVEFYKKGIKENVIELSPRDFNTIVEAVNNPPELNEALKTAAKKYMENKP